jgi:tetratricopeptide (TPR) repeat protein
MKSALGLILFAASALLAQNPPPVPGAGSTGTASGHGGNPGSIPDAEVPTAPLPDSGGRIFSQPNQSTFFSGRIMMADGLPLPPGVPIIRVCFSSQRTVAYTDSKGQFSFQLGTFGGGFVSGDASEISGPLAGPDPRMSRAPAMTQDTICDLRADLAGYSSSVLHLEPSPSGSYSGLSIVLHRLSNVEGTSVSATLYTAPADARKAYEKGTQSLQKGRLPEAEKDLEKAVEIYPKFANAWLSLGHVRERENQNESARDAFLKAIEVDSKMVEAQLELGIMAARDKKWRDAAQYLDAALKLDRVDFPQIWFTDAVANFNSANYDAAEKAAREALKADAAHKNPQIDQLLGMALAQKHEYAEAAEELRTYLKLAPTASDYTAVKTQLDHIEELAGKTQ